MGGAAWVILIGGPLGAVLAGVTISEACEETAVLGQTLRGCSQEHTTTWVVAAAVATGSIISALLLFAGRHVLLLLAEIAEKE